MFVDACAIVAVLSGEKESARVSDALLSAKKRFTSPVAILETALALSRQDKFNISVAASETIIMEFLEARAIDIRDLPPAHKAASLAISAAHRYRTGRSGLNLGDCLHYACAKYYRVPILATDDEFRNTDLETVG